MKFFIVDAFSGKLFGGNPAGVVIIPEKEEFPSDEIMVKTAAELRYSETAFVKELGQGEYKVRYFTPAAEVELCGHATIATFYTLMKEGLIAEGETCMAHTLAGNIEVKAGGDSVLMDMATPQLIGKMEDAVEIDRLYEIMGTEYNQKSGLIPMLITTGLPDIMMPVATRRELDALEPDMKALSELSAKYKVTGVHAFTLDADAGVTCHCRNFAPLYDIDEEAATGTSNGALTYYLYLNKIIGESAQCKIIQGEAMGRPSEILTSLDVANGICHIKVGGRAAILAKGEINI